MRVRSHILRTIPLLCITAPFFLGSCSIEKKLGKEYLAKRSDTAILLMMPESVYKYNLKTYDFPGIDSLSEWQQDSILTSNSLFIKFLSDTAVLAGFKTSFSARLQKYPIDVYPESSLDSFLLRHHNGLLVHVAQISFEEYVYPYAFEYFFVDEPYSVGDIDLNALNMNVWVEISRLNSEKKNEVLFAGDHISDSLDGYFRQYLFTGQIQFEYSVDSLTMPQVYSFIEEMGGKCAGYLFDHLLNGYIRENAPERYPYDLRPVHWNPVKLTFEYAKPEDQFIELDPEK